MPKGKKGGTKEQDYVQCATCLLPMKRFFIDEHYKIYKNGGKAFPPHPRTAYTKLINELEDPTDKESDAIKTQSIFAALGIVVPNNNNNNDNNNNNNNKYIVDPTYHQNKKRNRKPPLRSTVANIEDLFNKINENILEEEKLNNDQKYFNRKMKSLMEQIKGSKINIDAVLEDEENDYNSIFSLLSDINNTLMASKTFINNVSNIFSLQTKDVYSLCGLILKYYYNGSRITTHELCAEGYALKYCASCCDTTEFTLGLRLTNFSA